MAIQEEQEGIEVLRDYKGMVKAPYYDANGLKKGAWSEEEDHRLRDYIHRYGHWNWRQLPKFAGLNRCGKSCRLRWLNYLRPDVKRGDYTPEEDQKIITLHRSHGSRWSVIAMSLPGRTDNEIKNHWHTRLKKRLISCAAEHSGGSDQRSDGGDVCHWSMISSSTPPSHGAAVLQEECSEPSSPALLVSAVKPAAGGASSLEAVEEWYGGEFWMKPFMEDSLDYTHPAVDHFGSPPLFEDGGLSPWLSYGMHCADDVDIWGSC